MSNVGKATDGMLDRISKLQHQRDAAKNWIQIYQDSNLIPPEVASHLWEVLMGLEIEEQANDNLVPSDQP